MTAPIEFFFDFSSPYGYIAASRAEAIEQATGRELSFNPYLMGALFKSTGRQPLASHPLVWDYAKHDVARTARRFGIDFNLPEPFPVATASACRAFYWVSANEGDDAARALAMDLLRTYFVDGRNIATAETVAGIAAAGGRDEAAVREALADPAHKEALRERTDAAAARGIFGSPYFIVDGEPFWGQDRVDDVIRWALGERW